MSLVWDNYHKGGSEKLALLALADWCDDSGGKLYPSIMTIARKINVSESQARRIVHSFIDDGYIVVTSNHYGGNKGMTRNYQFNLDKLICTPSTHDTPSIDATPSTHATAGVAPMRATPSTHDTLTINNHHITTKTYATRLPIDWIAPIEYINYCNKKRPDLDANHIADIFKDYWISLPDKNAKKIDWLATWRNWVRNQKIEVSKFKNKSNVVTDANFESWLNTGEQNG